MDRQVSSASEGIHRSFFESNSGLRAGFPLVVTCRRFIPSIKTHDIRLMRIGLSRWKNGEISQFLQNLFYRIAIGH